MRLLYANHDVASTIFAAALEALAGRHPDRFELRLHEDVDRGFVTPAAIEGILGDQREDDCYVCGPVGFMSTVEAALEALGVPEHRIRIERFTSQDIPADAINPAAPAAHDITLAIRSAGRAVTVAHRPGTTILQAARSAGLRAPSSCETGTCATCMARVIEGRVEMRNNEALTDDEVADGWVLTCQADPRSPHVSLVYE